MAARCALNGRLFSSGAQLVGPVAAGCVTRSGPSADRCPLTSCSVLCHQQLSAVHKLLSAVCASSPQPLTALHGINCLPSNLQLYLPRVALEGGTDVTTAKSSAVNVIVPGATGACWGWACLPGCCAL